MTVIEANGQVMI